MTDAEKLQAVRAYFNQQFPAPAYLVSDTYDASGLCQVLRIDKGSELLHLVAVSDEFLEAHQADRLSTALDESGVLDLLERAGARRVVLSRGGPRIDQSG